jgi:nicotinamide-nucleotide amidase
MGIEAEGSMIATLISIGDELLVGQVVNTNATWLGDQLTRIGCHVRRVVAVGDDLDIIRGEMREVALNSDVVIVSGGLGPTHDDMTREAICGILDCEMVMDEPQLKRIEQRFAERGVALNERSRLQAMVPSACRVLPNDYGSAPGLAFAIGDARVYALPGVPSEMRGIVADHILPELRAGAGDVEQMTFLCFGVAESTLADALIDTMPLLGRDVTLAYLPSTSGIRLRAMRLAAGAEERYAGLLAIIREKAARWIVSERDEPFAAAVGRVFRERGLTLATAESCTGGMIGALVTEIPGSSAYYLGGVVSYANSAKSGLLGVDPALIERHGAVSSEVAEAMVTGARAALGADIAIAVTGVAGPDGGSEEKPVGTVWIAVASAAGVRAERHQLGRERDYIRARAASTALDMARREALAMPT